MNLHCPQKMGMLEIEKAIQPERDSILWRVGTRIDSDEAIHVCKVVKNYVGMGCFDIIDVSGDLVEHLWIERIVGAIIDGKLIGMERYHVSPEHVI